MKNLLICSIICFLIWNMSEAKVTIKNYTDMPIKVYVHYIGIGSPSKYKKIDPQQEVTKTKDLANIKTRYQVWVLEKDKERLVVDKNDLSDAGAFRKLDVYQAKEPKSKEVIYGIYRYGG